MKKLIFTLIITASELFAVSQAWEKNLPQEKVENGSVNFFDIQKAFNDYCDEHNVKAGYYYKDGEMKKSPGYKQFKRWEYNWETKVDPITGEFPSITAQDMINAANFWKSTTAKSAGEWENISIGNTTRVGRVNCIAFHPDDENIIYAGTPGGGLWKTLDHGATWIPLTDNIPSLGVSSIVVVPSLSGDIIYIGTGDKDADDTYSVGILKSIDGGVTWNTTGLSYNMNQKEQVTGLIKHPENSNILFATTTVGFYRTTNGGVDWNLLFTPSTGRKLYDIELHPTNPTHIYVSTGRKAANAYIYRSFDMGNNWTQIFTVTGATRIEMAVSPDKPNWMYALVAKKRDENGDYPLKGIYKTVNAGNSFFQTLDGDDQNLLNNWPNPAGQMSHGQGHYDLAIAVNPYNADEVFVGGINTHHSTDGGFSWHLENLNNIAEFVISDLPIVTHADKHQLIFRPDTEDLYECNDGGIFKRILDKVWVGLSEGMAISQVSRFGLNHSSKKKIDLLAGLQDNGTHKLKDDSNWNRILHSDGFECVVDYEHPTNQYASTQEGRIYRTKTGWVGIPENITVAIDFYTWPPEYAPKPPLDEMGGWSTPYVMDPDDHKTLYLGLENVWKSIDQGEWWEKISDFGKAKKKIDALVVAPSNPNYIYAAVDNKLYYTSNGGDELSWNDISPGNYITYIAVKNSDPSTIWVTSSGFDPNNVYKWDGVWSDISAGLPEVPVYCIVQNKYNNDAEELYAGTETGVYRKVGCNDWEPFISGLPNVKVSELEIKYTMGYTWGGTLEKVATLYAATYGRSIWKTRLEDVDYRLWTGEISFNWFDPNNWCPAEVPVSNTVVHIPNGCPYWPIIDTLILGKTCKHLNMLENSELNVNIYLEIGEEKKLVCESGSRLYVGGAWNNINSIDMINNNFGFLPEPGSEVIFIFQIHSPVAAISGTEIFQNLTVSKEWPAPGYFNPFCNIIVKEECKILTNRWTDGTILHHQMFGNFTIEYTGAFGMQGNGILEFVGSNPQFFSFKTNEITLDSYNSLGTVKVNANVVHQNETDLTGNKRIQQSLDIVKGIYGIGASNTTEAGGVTISSGATLELYGNLLVGGGIQVMSNGLLNSQGTLSEFASIGKLPGGVDYNFLVQGNISAEHTGFSGMNQHGVRIVPPTGNIIKIDHCTFSSSSMHPEATLLKINNNQLVSLNDLSFTFIGPQKTITKTENIGVVDVYGFDPPNSNLHEGDIFNRINWYSSSKSSEIRNMNSKYNTEFHDKIKVYPNPSSGYFVIENYLTSEENMNFQISDLTGQVIYSGYLLTGLTTVHTDNISKGIYILKIAIGNEYLMRKIVIN